MKTKKNNSFRIWAGILIGIYFQTSVTAQNSYISTSPNTEYFPLVTQSAVATIYMDSTDFSGVLKTAGNFRKDIERVSDQTPSIILNSEVNSTSPIIIGTLGKSKIIQDLVERNKLEVNEIEGKWETFSIQIVKNPYPNVAQALIIVGSDKRGTIFGMYDVSAEIGVSPWYWWADVPVSKNKELYVTPGKHSKGTPKVKYRGIFINDEAPALSGWSSEKFGGFNHKFYEHVFELILRLKGNYLWPAMWGSAFYDDDPKNPFLANEYGVVIGTSHHEPLMRAHDEWRRFGNGDWNYNTNPENLRKFWKEGMKRMGNNESIVTVGMRGDGDEPMSEGTAISLLENIVKDQREIIAEVTGKPTEETPQVWALYKEVQDYYDQGMRVPEDVTLLLADDNWGNIRKLPNPKEKPRAGGYGIYYHFDYVGGPRNYKWVNTTQISRVWEQMNLAYNYDAKRLWIVNVGDIKPMEFPISFFLDYAWNPEAISELNLETYAINWAKQQFGEAHATEIADLLLSYTKYNSRRKPELLSPETYSLTNYNEAEKILTDYKDLVAKAEKLNEQLAEDYKDAFYQLVLFPIQASANLNELYITAGRNKLYAKQGRAATNETAEKVKELFQRDSILTDYYHHELADGKWNHMMSQTHIGYTYWQQPEHNNMPKVEKVILPEKPEMGVAVEGSTQSWPNDSVAASLPVFDPYNDQKYYIEIFNKGKSSFNYTIKNKTAWLKISEEKGNIEDQEKIWLQVDWMKAPKGLKEVPVIIKGGNSTVAVTVKINNFKTDSIRGFVESNGYISMEAVNYSRNLQDNNQGWKKIPNLGRTASAMAPLPSLPIKRKPAKTNDYLVYDFFTTSSGEMKIDFYLSPTLDYQNEGGIEFAYSIDNSDPKILNLVNDSSDSWDTAVSNNLKIVNSEFKISSSGNHSLKIWPIDSGVVLQKIVIKSSAIKPSYLGPPESYKVKVRD
ncbi:glycosyl hydrolase 115 family protein [Gillisia sp. M10.2A]|uniref:Glycosyl hydrolase 115 family protein n=1 Tax=Gillisia lutea TaxID=2909668 RepID=A0ABS9EI12_9FLAO|nr:glycosyl hydrolase 115 family protein [Gillisia lutea]MCF4101086.1 glycosyl hydrolase 115 family protein [Gillisia lutea]